MFQIGDIVRPKKCYKGHNYCFKVTEIKKEPFVKDLYRIQRIEQELDGDYSPTFQLNIIKTVEQCLWEENELELISNIKLRYAETDINIPVYNHVILDEMVEELTKQNKTNKEENKMQILEIYKERKIKAIEKEYLEAKEMTRKDDEIQKIIIEMTNQVNTILENQGTTAIYEFNPSLVTAKTQERFELLEKGKDKAIEELRSTLDEIRALFELTDDYNERIKILKDYNILDKKGKLNI
jgi:hypothetical protein